MKLFDGGGHNGGIYFSHEELMDCYQFGTVPSPDGSAKRRDAEQARPARATAGIAPKSPEKRAQ